MPCKISVRFKKVFLEQGCRISMFTVRPHEKVHPLKTTLMINFMDIKGLQQNKFTQFRI